MNLAVLVLSFVFLLDEIEGRNVKIVNGQTSKPGQFPYQAMLIGTRPDGRILCGGSLISDEWVLTAAHCVSGVLWFDVHLGAQSFSNYTEPGREIFTTFDAIIHERYIPSIAANDLGLVKLPRRVNFTNLIQPVLLANNTDQFVGRTVTASGWGLKSSAESSPAEQLQYANLDVISNAKCEETYNPIVVRPSILCAQGDDYESVCSGDSGGPLVLNGTRTLVGVTSFGHVIGCDYGFPGGFSRVSYYVDWIKSKIEKRQ